jgi:hypothetical protein
MSLLLTTASTLLREPTLDHGVDAFVAVEELRHTQVSGEGYATDQGISKCLLGIFFRGTGNPQG